MSPLRSCPSLTRPLRLLQTCTSPICKSFKSHVSLVLILNSHLNRLIFLSVASSTAHPPFIDNSAPRRAKGHIFEAARQSKKSRGPGISIALLRKKFPELLKTISWAKARYRSLSLFAPYISGIPEKLLVAERAYDFGLTKHSVTISVYPDMPSRDAMVLLVRFFQV